MNFHFKDIFSLFYSEGIKVYALVGKSGTGKSFRSQYVANKYRIELIIDDGLLIRNNKIIAGKSAKKEKNFISAMKRALFRDETHCQETITAIQKEKSRKILIIGTSEKMIFTISQRLNLPSPFKIIKIEDVTTKEEIETALRIRYTEGKHVIPVPAIEITRTSPGIVYDSIQVFLKKMPFWRKEKSFEKTLVKPDFAIPKQTVLSKTTFMQMLSHCFYEFDYNIKIESLETEHFEDGYKLKINLRSPNKIQPSYIPEIQEFVIDSLERYGGIHILDAKVDIVPWS
ncbi:MAG: hypothetical protein WC162_01925 [Sphaerochaetaceae bacterium]|nr:hypothetical protein [Sphaerochaetaceae bacterium]